MYGGVMIAMRFEMRQELRAPIPPEAVQGLAGIAVARQVLERYGAVGLLIGGLAREFWQGTKDPAAYDDHKDVDVLILSFDCQHHPRQWEAGVDWWVSHDLRECPTNGTDVGLIWQLRLRPNASPAPGLYLCPREVYRAGRQAEERVLGGYAERLGNRRRAAGLMPLPSGFLVVRWGREEDNVATHCQPYS